MFLQARVGIEEDNPLCLKVFPDLVIYHLRVVYHEAFGDEVVWTVNLDVVHRLDGIRLDRLDPLEAKPVVAVNPNRRAMRAIRRMEVGTAPEAVVRFGFRQPSRSKSPEMPSRQAICVRSRIVPVWLGE